ncbi:GSCOCG00010443001-RA-CDS [Cotesia congregata]|uniref:Uncharacterized protein n=1 Tax=Cotesia congregata TaxID=51543 RepID=A0A8J2MI87_COTCN|nr:GSCOCG00010443001-RA-CDS [Cotesia congregata]CAG5085475.1 Protein of unknown function [Cotesia congregata]
MSTCTDDADNSTLHIQDTTMSPVQEGPISPASSCLSNQNQNDEVLLATMQPVNVMDLHETEHIHHKYNQHHHHHHHQRHHQHHPHHHHHHHHHQEEEEEEENGRSPQSSPSTGLGHKMIDLIYNDGQKTVMYTHDKEIIYESEADRVQVVEYPPPNPSPSPPATPQSTRNLVNVRHAVTTNVGNTATLHLHHYPQLQLHQHDEDDLPRGAAPSGAVNGNSVSSNTTTTVLVLSELVAADPSTASAELGLTTSGPTATLRTG